MPLTQRVNTFANNPLNRAGHLRNEEGWLSSQISAETALFVPLWRGDALILPETKAGQGRDVAWLPKQALASFPDNDPVFLGLNRNNAPRFAVDISGLESPGNVSPFDALCRAGGVFENLRTLAMAGDMPGTELAILAQAKGLLAWHGAHGFCARCGNETTIREGGYKRICSTCQAEHFPRTDPVVIMLPCLEDKCLLGRRPEWPDNLFSALAGFMEPGESIEEAVARETMEEAGVSLNSVTYHSTQPWPFPSSLMIGCLAEAESAHISVDKKELVEARWFSVAEIKAALDGTASIDIPPPLAIARHLMRAFVEMKG